MSDEYACAVGKSARNGLSVAQVANQETHRVVAVQAGSQPAWGNERDQSEDLLATLRFSQALMKEAITLSPS